MRKKRLLIYFSICLSLFVLLGVAFFYLSKLNNLEKYSAQVDHSYEVILQMGKLEKNLLDAETGQRGFIITSDSIFLEPYSESHREILQIFQRLDTLTRDNPQQQSHLDTLRALILTTTSLLAENMSDFKHPSVFKEEFEKGRYYMVKIRKSMDNLKKNENDLLVLHDKNKRLNSNSSKTSSYIMLIIAFGACSVGAIGIVKFFNQSQKYQVKLNVTIQKLKVLNKEILDLTYASSHNLQEPMRKVQLIIDKMENVSQTESEIAESMARIKQIYANQQLTNNVIVAYYDILNTSTPKKSVDLNQLITELFHLNEWDEKLRLEIGNLQAINADPYQLKLLFTHLIENTIHFNPDKKDLRLTVEEISAGQFIDKFPEMEGKIYRTISVSDNGKGVENAMLSKIFELFQKVDLTLSGESNRKGMGLSFSKRIMLNHNGWIVAQNNAAGGLTILLFFPIEDKL